jgi:translocator protein
MPLNARLAPLPRLALAVLPVAAASLTGALITAPNIPTWYAGLAKPAFAPPNWLFAPVWTALYAMMALAFWRVLGLPPGTPGRAAAIAAFWAQLALNAAWTPVFFGLHSPRGGLAVIGVLLVTILVTIRRFWPLDRIAAALLVPYAAWVAFATALTAEVARLNP